MQMTYFQLVAGHFIALSFGLYGARLALAWIYPEKYDGKARKSGDEET